MSPIDSVISVVTWQISLMMFVRLIELTLIEYKVVNRSLPCATLNWDLRIGKKSVISCCLEQIGVHCIMSESDKKSRS